MFVQVSPLPLDCPQTRLRQLSDLVTWRGKRGTNHTPNAIYMRSGLRTLFSSRTAWVYCFPATISCQNRIAGEWDLTVLMDKFVSGVVERVESKML
ncbi:hypothetical protein EG68_11945 [Paragonimus skrjabini miyazakii]|uniref:Uncharacterized protein n=1 Tax=Paragonimus skrjabini miyazakii TaxID=59628 RepID=A0A8S9YI48_9TREM|nr:hypothetical protein EG68_11945 [Paragonimus skrjabini miyazakii]